MNAATGFMSGGKGFGEILNRLRANPKIPLLVAAAAAIVVAMVLWAKSMVTPIFATLIFD
ncbi:MAG: hypothetical protein ACR5LC_13130 [Symbiopectobacterium sp.]|uniref:hypothetical protein n=1 Tax=Symbiopectobacterium sp. TaxID=2952789 RepID=UPI003F313DF0